MNSKHKKKKQSKPTYVSLDSDQVKNKPATLTSPKKKISEIREEIRFQCQNCSTEVESEEQFKDHMACHDGKHDAVSQIMAELLCKVCDELFDSGKDIKKHMSNQHATNGAGKRNEGYCTEQTDLVNVESLQSCEKCDFDTDDTESLKKHIRDNIHNVSNKNKTLVDEDEENPKSTAEENRKADNKMNCYMCEYETKDLEMFDEHCFKKHGIIKCDKCEYRAEDKEIMNKHMKRHTGRFNFNCNICEFETTKQSMLEDHIELKHSSTKTSPAEKPVFGCDRCEQQFSYSFLLKEHTCQPLFKYPCEMCTFIAVGLIEILEHMDKVHKTKNLVQCPHCDFKAQHNQDLDFHITEKHDQLADDTVNINEEKSQKSEEEPNKANGTGIKCDKCDFVADEIPVFISHIRTGHTDIGEDCQYCDHVAKSEEYLEAHMYDKHTEIVMVHAMAKQMNEVSYRMEHLETFKVELGNAIKLILDSQNSMRREVLDYQNSIKQELSLIKSEQTKLTKMKLTEDKEEMPNSKTQPTPVTKPDKETLGSPALDGTTKRSPNSKPVKKNLDDKGYASKNKLRNEDLKKHHVTWIGTSISKALKKEKIEQDLNVRVTAIKAYCVNEEGRYPKSNFKAIIPDIVKKKDVDTLVLETGSIEISNMDVNKALMDSKKNINEYKREWFEKAEEVSTELFGIAEEAIAVDENLHVIILKRLPRFDRSSNDLIKIKSNLSDFANQMYDQLWLRRGCPERIHIVDIKLAGNSQYLKDLICGTVDKPRYDGIHLIGSGASRHFTYRTINAIKPFISKPNINQKKPYFWRQKQTTGNTNAQQSHLDCPQAVYMRQSSGGRLTARSGILYSDILKGSSQQKTDCTYSVQTKNFFNPLNC